MEKKKLYRSKTDSVIAGVCGGLAEYFEIDSTIVRIIFVILAIWGGIGIILYIIGALIIPYRDGKSLASGEKSKETNEKIKEKAEEFSETVKTVASDFKDNINDKNVERRGGVVFGLILLLLGIMFLLRNFFSWFDFDIFWPLILIIIGILLIAGAGRRGHK